MVHYFWGMGQLLPNSVHTVLYGPDIQTCFLHMGALHFIDILVKTNRALQIDIVSKGLVTGK